jgi:hypothetical protein
VAIAVMIATAVGGAIVSPPAEGATTTRPAARVPALDRSWFALGANLPWYVRGCDFGCGRTRGVRANREQLDDILREMSRRGVRVVRWELFPNDAWQVSRTADGTPTEVAAAALVDLDEALALAARHDVFLLPVVLPDPDRVPVTWFTDDAQSRALAAALRPMFARYASNEHLLGWELVSAAEQLEDSGDATRAQLRLHGIRLVGALDDVAPRRLAFIGPGDVTRIDTWSDLGADVFTPRHLSNGTGAACASCRDADDVATAEGTTTPIVIGAWDVPTEAAGASRLDSYVERGYAGALAWSWREVAHPDAPDATVRMPDTATWRLHNTQSTTGPRSRPLNPCYGPAASSLRCPNLRMSKPSALSLASRGGKQILFSTNSLDSVGAGPASLRGNRDGQYTMAARQVLHRVGAPPVTIDTDARLLFKAIPGQYRYWKWNGAARMELWRLDSRGELVERTRVGPKTVYCLRDLKRTRGFLPRSPRSQYYPGCSQRLSQQSVTLGTSVGWSDVYPATYHENWVDVTGLRGCFAYVHVADPTNAIYESDEDDNASSVVVRLPFRGANTGCPGAGPLPTVGATGTY